MFDPQHYVDLHDNGSFGDPKSWLAGEEPSSPTHRRTHSSLSTMNASNGNVDRVLFNDLVEIVPLVQSLIDRKASSSFTRRGSIVYTKTPSRESYSRRITEPKGRNTTQSIPTKKKRDNIDKEQDKKGTSRSQDGDDSFSIFSSRAVESENDKADLIRLTQQVEELQRRLLEKDDILKSIEISKDQMTLVHEKLEDLKHQVEEKDSLVKSTQSQLSDAKIKLADKQAAVEKLQWEVMTCNTKAKKLQEELASVQEDAASFMMFIEGLTNNGFTKYEDDYDFVPYQPDHVPLIDNINEMEMQKMEEARQAYMAAVAAAKEKQDEESIAIAADARKYLRSFVF